MRIGLSLALVAVGCGVVFACGSSASTNPNPAGNLDASTSSENDGSNADDGSSNPIGEGGTSTFDGPVYKAGTAITATANQWTFIPFDNAFCLNGSTTGIGINPSSTGSRVLVYLEGGGACWSAETCYTLMTASNVGGYGPTEFAAESTDTSYIAAPGGFFDRTSATNPFKDYSYVYVPYCTGDVHAGYNQTTLGTTAASFVGYGNMTAYLDRIVPTFPSADRVILAGSSAGGYGALYNWYQTQNAFGSVRVDVLDDSGTFLPADVPNTYFPDEVAAWNLTATAPPCAACETDPSQYYGFYAKLYPTHKLALLSYQADTVLPQFFGITTAQFTTGLTELITQQFTPNANAKVFVDANSGHVLLLSPTLTQGTTSVEQFVTEMVTDDAAWASVTP